MNRAQWARAWHIAAKDMRTYYLKPPLISWGMMFPAVMILAFYLNNARMIHESTPGMVAMTVLFGATSVEAVVIAFEKRIGAMERLVMAPVSIGALLIGKATSGMLFGAATGALVWLGTSLAWGLPLAAGAPLVPIVLGSATFSLLGVLISIVMREVFDAMTVCNFVRFPMIFLGGVFVPLVALSPVLRLVSWALPLTYMVDSLRYFSMGAAHAYLPLWLDLVALVLFGALLYVVSLVLMRNHIEDLL